MVLSFQVFQLPDQVCDYQRLRGQGYWCSFTRTKSGEVEALACHRAVILAAEIGIHEVIFEADTQVIINQLQSEEHCTAHFGNIIEDSKAH